jgi:hypothetical protein
MICNGPRQVMDRNRDKTRIPYKCGRGKLRRSNNVQADDPIYVGWSNVGSPGVCAIANKHEVPQEKQPEVATGALDNL